MNQAELIGSIAHETGISKKDVETVLKIAGEAVKTALCNSGEVTLPGIGKLTVKTSAARKGRNPATGAEIDIPAKQKPHFSAAKVLKDAVAA
jgi:DNA-binding protein HU-beta